MNNMNMWIKTLERLKAKAKDEKCRMPSIVAIHELLKAFNIEHEFLKSVNVVEYRTRGRKYVNSRHMGKEGYKIIIQREDRYFKLNTSDSYYSWNSHRYAIEILDIIHNEGKLKRQEK